MSDIKTSPEAPNISEESYCETQFSDERIKELTGELIESSSLKEKANGRQFAVVRRDGNDRFADIATSVETKVFADAFDRSLADVYEDYVDYSEQSVMIAVLDIEKSIPVASARVIGKDTDRGKGLKDLEDLVVNDEIANPWINEIKSLYFSDDEPYDPELAKQKLAEAAGMGDFTEERAYDVATRSVIPEYRESGLSTPGMALLHSVLDVTTRDGKEFLFAIQDIGPLKMIQRMGHPFYSPEGLQPHPFGGPYDTIPTYARISTGFDQMRELHPAAASVLIDGEGLDEDFTLLKEM